MFCRIKEMTFGDRVPVKHSRPYLLPEGLSPGDVVTIIAFDLGSYTVEQEGRKFTVPMQCMNPGHIFQMPDGSWVGEDDPRVQESLYRTLEDPKFARWREGFAEAFNLKTSSP